MIRSKEEDSQTFLQFVEDCGIRAYNELVTQSIGHIWNEKNRINLQEKHDKKRKQEEDIKRWEEVITEGRHQRSSSVSMPAPAEKPSPHKHHFPCSPGFTVRSQSLHSVGEGVEEDEDEGSPTSRKQPPPKPRRDPTTKLSISSEAVDLSPTTGKGEDLEHCDGTQGSSEDCRKVPPPKPRRNPNTQLSTSFDESYARNHGSKGSPTIHFLRDRETPLQSQNQQDSDGDEPVYIEMSGNVMREPDNHNEEDEPGEAVYEEMKYPSLDEFESRFDALSCRSQCVTPCLSEIDLYAPVSRCTTPRGTLCDIPPPFPNLLTHRPPLLVFPPSPAQCSPKSKESSLTPLDMTKLQMVENGSHGKSSSLDSASTSHLRRAERELTATPTITVSGRSSAPPLPCALYKSSSSLHGYQRSHSACPSPVSMGRCLTPLSLMRSPPFDGPFPGAGLPRSASATPHGKGSPPHDMTYGGRHHSSMQNVSVARSRTPTSPLDELTNLFTTGRNMLKKNTSGRRNKELGEGETKGKSHESKRDHKERSHHKDSKRDKERSGSGKSSHRRDNKDKLQLSAEAFSRHEHKDAGYSKPEPLARRDSKDKGCNCADLPVRQESKDQGSSMDGAPQRDSKDRGCNTVEIIFRRDSRERGCNGLDHLPGQDGKELQKNGLSTRRDSTEKTGFVVDHLARHELKDQSRSALQSRQERKDSGTHGVESGQDKEKNNHGESRRGSKEAISNDRGTHTNEALPRYKWKEKKSFNKDSPKTLDKYARSGSSALSGASHSTRATTRPTEAQGSSNSDLKPVPKANRSTPVDSSPVGTPQRQHLDLQQIPPMPWLYGDSTMMEMIEKKQRLCREIRSCQRPQHNHCKVESLPSISSWKKTNGAKKYGPPPYSTHTTVFWDTAI